MGEALKAGSSINKEQIYGLYKSICYRRHYLCSGSDPDGKDETDAGTDHGTVSRFRSHSGAVGIYEPFLSWAGAGASIPLLGFGNTLFKGVKTALAEEGVLGLFKGGLTAASAGITGALIFGYSASVLFKPKMK